MAGVPQSGFRSDAPADARTSYFRWPQSLRAENPGWIWLRLPCCRPSRSSFKLALGGHDHAVRFFAEIGIPGRQARDRFGTEPAVHPVRFLDALAGELRRGTQPAAVSDVTNRPDAKAGPLQYQLQCPGGEVRQVSRQVEAKPGVAKPAE